MNQKDRILLELRSILIVRFISEFCELEKLIISTFQEKISQLNNDIKNELYFYYGIYSSHNVYYDFEKKCVSINNNRFNENELFKSLSLKRIINYEKRNHLIEAFNFELNSLIRKQTVFPFYDCCEKLINMRNKMAHELDSISFSEKEIIELLPDGYLTNYNYDYLASFTVSDMDADMKVIFSNIIYIRTIIHLLERG